MTSFCLSNSSTAVGQADSGSNPKIEQVSKKAALLIGIADDLLGSHKDVNMMYELLTGAKIRVVQCKPGRASY